MIDGGKSSDASARIKKKMAAIIHSELLACEDRRDKDKPLLYLEHSFLTMHRYCTVNKEGPILSAYLFISAYKLIAQNI